MRPASLFSLRHVTLHVVRSHAHAYACGGCVWHLLTMVRLLVMVTDMLFGNQSGVITMSTRNRINLTLADSEYAAVRVLSSELGIRPSTLLRRLISSNASTFLRLADILNKRQSLDDVLFSELSGGLLQAAVDLSNPRASNTGVTISTGTGHPAGTNPKKPNKIMH